MKGQYPQSWMAGTTGQLYPEEKKGLCLLPRWTVCPLPSQLAHSTHHPEQILVVHHHLYHLGGPLCQLLLPALEEFGRLPSVKEEIRGHYRGNIPQCHLVALLLGHHLPEEFQECLGKGTELSSNLSTPLLCPTFPRTSCCATWGPCKEPGAGIGVLVSTLPSAHFVTSLSVSGKTFPLPCSLRG